VKNKKRIVVWMLVMSCCFLSIFQVNKANAQATTSLKEIDQFIQNSMNKNNIPGLSVAITHHDKVIYTKGYGHTSDNKPVTSDTPFAVASLSKAFTAIAVMQLVESGKIKLDTPIASYIPNFKLADPRGTKITVRHLLQHTSGLTDMVNDDMTQDPQPKSFKEAIQNLNNVTLATNPGEKYNYHNPNYVILAYLVEIVSKEKFADYLQQHIFQPLEMKSTTNVASTSLLKKITNFSAGHYHLFGHPVKIEEPDWFVNGPAGMVSTANDMARWLVMQGNEGKYKNKQILSTNGMEQTHTSVDPNVKYGMGWNITETEQGKKQIQHGGILWTYKAEEVLLPDEGYGIVVLFNSGLNSFVDYTSFTRGIANILTDQPLEESFFSNQWIEIMMVIVIVVTIVLGVRALLRLGYWDEKRNGRAKWRTYSYMCLRLIPLVLLLLFPQLLAFIGGGRVVIWQGIYLMMPSVLIWLSIFSLFQLIIILTRLVYILKK
jgi:CubicO group peptidase (beta-lactamase class C family)